MHFNRLCILADAFRNVKQNILWKWEDESLPNLPANVLVKNWLPQNDILMHENVRLFISHGGLFGTTEALQRGVPMLYIPLFGDQLRNAIRAVNIGYAEMLRISEITESNLPLKLDVLLNDPKYLAKAKEVSRIIMDRPIHPMNESIYWVEYVIRHGGAKHLKSAAANLSFFTYFLMDVFAVIAIGMIVIFLVMALTMKFVISSIIGGFSNKATGNSDAKKKKT